MPSVTPLLGVMHGHFDINANVRVVGDVDYPPKRPLRRREWWG
jgi:hypothetical protein